MTTNEYLYDTEETNRIRELAMGRRARAAGAVLLTPGTSS